MHNARNFRKNRISDCERKKSDQYPREINPSFSTSCEDIKEKDE